MAVSSNEKAQPWFKAWFDTPYYHLLYQDRDEAEARFFLDGLVNQLNLPKGARILDMACGNGRHAHYLAKLGYQVVGFDIADAQVQKARQLENNNLAFYQHDMRYPFNLGSFDLVLNLFTSFGYFEEEETHKQVIQNVADALEPKGLFIIDFMNVHYILNNLKPAETIEKNGVTFHVNRYKEHGFVKKRILVEDGNRNHLFKEKVRAFTLENFEVLLKEANFTLQNLFGSYDLADFDPQQSERLIIIAEKNHHA